MSTVIMLADESQEMGNKSPGTLGGTPVSLMVYVEDVDATYDAAIAAGATEIQALEDKFYGDRAGMFKDPWGHDYQYEYPPTHGKGESPDIWSLGPDGEDNTEDDIVSWSKDTEHAAR